MIAACHPRGSAVFDAHVRAEFVEQSADATMATMIDAPHVTHVRPAPRDAQWAA